MRHFGHPFLGAETIFGTTIASRGTIMALLVAAALCPAAASANSCQGDVADDVFVIDSSQSQVAAKVRFFGLTTRSASFPKVTGRVIMPNGHPDNIRLDVRLDASMLQAADGLTTSRLRSQSFFDVAQFPEVRLHRETFLQTGASAARIGGTLTARGVSKPVTLNLTFSKQIAAVRHADSLDITGEMHLDRTQFGMTAYPLVVGREVTVSLRVHIAPERSESCRTATR